MPHYLITKTITAHLLVECANEQDAQNWSERIVATIEDEYGHILTGKPIEEFDVHAGADDTLIEVLVDEQRIPPS